MATLHAKIAKLPTREQNAVWWVRSNYRNWRKHFSETEEQYMARRPAHLSEERWRAYFAYPFGNAHMNENCAIVRRLLAEGKL